MKQYKAYYIDEGNKAIFGIGKVLFYVFEYISMSALLRWKLLFVIVNGISSKKTECESLFTFVCREQNKYTNII